MSVTTDHEGVTGGDPHDLVNRLELTADAGSVYASGLLCREAAAEIQRLQTALWALQESAGIIGEAHQIVLAQNASLRAELAELAARARDFVGLVRPGVGAAMPRAQARMRLRLALLKTGRYAE